MYQKALPVTKHTDVTKESPNLSKQLENIKTLNKKSRKSKKNIKNLEPALKYWEVVLPIYQIQMYEKAPLIVNYADIKQEIVKFVLATGKQQKSE